jgi:3-dehydroquinate dehydratase II
VIGVLVLSGPNLALLGTREPHIYGTETLDDIHRRLTARAEELGLTVDARQTNHEGTLVDWIGAAQGPSTTRFVGILLNPGGYGHTSIAIRDAIAAVALPCIEVHLSNPDAREPFRRRSMIASVCRGRVTGFGGDSYLLALDGLASILRRK